MGVVVPPTKTQEDEWKLGLWTSAGATDITGQRAVLPAWRDSKERVIVPGLGAGTV
jgi:hypothetical protein